MPTLSIIIPTFNEADHLGATLDALSKEHEIIVVDGSSTDATESVAGEYPVTFVSAPARGRAAQMNHGVTVATGEILLFLHADTILSGAAVANLLRAMELEPELPGGGFFRYFDSKSQFLKITCWLANLRSQHWGIFLGDQGIFVRREVFDTLGGFDESMPFGEDLDFSLRLRKAGKTAAVQPPVLSSARRFDKYGPIRQMICDLFATIRIINFRNSKLTKIPTL